MSCRSTYPLVVRSVACAAALALVACSSANRNRASYWTPSHDLGGASLVQEAGTAGSAGASAGGAGGSSTEAGAGGSGGQANPPPVGSVTFSVTTSSSGGRYSPRNVGAIWVETKSGQFVKTLTEWGNYRYNNLIKWGSEANYNTVDAVTGATSYSAGTHTGKWNFKDVKEQVVPDGQYQFIVEFTEDDSAFSSFAPPGPWASVPFTKGPNQKNFTVPDKTYFHNMSVSYSQQ